jgi:large subunit ribosomal protein L16
MLSPKRTKFRKQHKGRIHGLAKGGTDLAFGSYGLKAMAPERITARQIEAARRAMTRKIRRVGKIWIRVFPDVPVSSKPAEVRMGKGKGSPEFWVAKVKPGRIMFEMDGVPEPLAREAMALAAAKLPIPVKFVTRPAYMPIREEVVYEERAEEVFDDEDAAADASADGGAEAAEEAVQ